MHNQRTIELAIKLDKINNEIQKWVNLSSRKTVVLLYSNTQSELTNINGKKAEPILLRTLNKIALFLVKLNPNQFKA